mgnify:CR=1 FL=1
MEDEDVARAATGIGSLREPVRRELYRYVCGRDEPVGREEVAAATGIAHHSVKFHLDKLASDGLLAVDYQRLGDRSGPGAGRPAKVYFPADTEVSMSLPPREYALAGEVLAEAVEESVASGRPVLDVLEEVAAVRGVDLAREARPEGEALTDPAEAARVAAEVLALRGFRPREEEDRLVLANCPFHDLAQRHTGLVCGMTHAMLEGFTGELAPGCLTASLEPEPGRCCVVLRARERAVRT